MPEIAWMTAPPTMEASAVPHVKPMALIASARGSCRGGNESVRIENVAGANDDSPAPTPTRAQKS